MKRKYMVAAIPSSSFGAKHLFSCLNSPIEYMTCEVNGYINQDAYEKIAKELWEQQKLCLISITDVTDKELNNDKAD